jgi:hypothetical protein
LESIAQLPGKPILGPELGTDVRDRNRAEHDDNRQSQPVHHGRIVL